MLVPPPALAIPVPEAEIRELFSAATRRPVRSAFVADIEHEVTTAAAPETESRRSARQVAQWYSKNYFRTDENFGLQPGVNGGYLLKHVELYDPQFSPYNRFVINEGLRSIIVDKAPGRKKRCDELWAVFCFDPEVLQCLVAALTDLSPDELVKIARRHFFGAELLPPSPEKTRELSTGSSRDWSLERLEDEMTVPEARNYRLTGKLRVATNTYDVVNHFQVKTLGGRLVLLSAEHINKTFGSSYQSERDRFDAGGVPAVWRWTRSVRERSNEKTTILIYTAEDRPSFKDEDLFSVPTGNTHPNYVISDLTTGRGVALYRPKPLKAKASPPSNEARNRLLVIMIAASIAAIGAVVLNFRKARKTAPRVK